MWMLECLLVKGICELKELIDRERTLQSFINSNFLNFVKLSRLFTFTSTNIFPILQVNFLLPQLDVLL